MKSVTRPTLALISEAVQPSTAAPSVSPTMPPSIVPTKRSSTAGTNITPRRSDKARKFLEADFRRHRLYLTLKVRAVGLLEAAFS